jgi:asparagine synthase (glutamine-hydrolysing)
VGAIKAVTRRRDRILVDWGDGFTEFAGRLRPSRTVIASLALGQSDESFPLVHGFVRRGKEGAESPHSGEFSVLDRRDGDFLLERDQLGTRPLYFGTGVLASDHRFLPPGDGELLKPGALYRFSDGLRLAEERELEPEPWTGGMGDAAERLAEVLTRSVSDCISGCKTVAVSFSGGIDSALLALLASKSCEVVLCSVHTEGSRDERAPREAADLLGLELSEVAMKREDVVKQLSSLNLPFQPSRMDKSLWCIYSRAAEIAYGHHAGVIILGQLADELFGGYMKYAVELERNGTRAADGLMKKDVIACSSRAFIRDEAACASWTEPRFPFANEELVRFALGLPVDYKISGGTRKLVVREAAVRLGLPEKLAQSPKKAAQYSSGLLKFID